MKISKMVKYTIVTIIFAVLFVSEALGNMKFKENALKNFESELGSRLNTKIFAEYYDKNSSYGEPSIVFCEEGSNELKIVLAEDSSNRFNQRVHDAKVFQNEVGVDALDLIHKSTMISYVFVAITFIVYILFLVKISA